MCAACILEYIGQYVRVLYNFVLFINWKIMIHATPHRTPPPPRAFQLVLQNKSRFSLKKKGCPIGPQNQRVRLKKGCIFVQNPRKRCVFQTWVRASSVTVAFMEGWGVELLSEARQLLYNFHAEYMYNRMFIYNVIKCRIYAGVWLIPGRIVV